MNRRNFLKQTSLFRSPTYFALECIAFDMLLASEEALTIGLVADAHQDIMHDCEESAFQHLLKRLVERKTDFNLQLGDFCFPHTRK